MSHRQPSLELWRRDDAGTWSRRVAGKGESLRLESLGAVLDVEEIYRRGLGTTAI